MISHLYLSVLFLTPGLLISGVLKTQNRFLLTSSFSVFFWSISTLILEINYLINTFFGNLFVGLILLYWFLRFKNYQNIVYNLIILSILELINNVFGILHIVSTFSITLEAALQNLDYVSSSVNVPAVQITFLKFFNNDYFLATLPQFLGFSLLLSNSFSILNSRKLSKKYILAIVPAFLIFCVVLEIMTIRSHFFSSQILCFLIIETLKSKESRLNENIFFIFLCLFLSSRLENYYPYYPLLLLILTKYIGVEDKRNSKIYIKLLSATSIPILINFNSLSGGDDIRGDMRISIALILILNIFIFFKDKSLIAFLYSYINHFFALGIVGLAIINFVLYDFKALHSWLFLITHLLDTHRGWVIATLYFLLLIIYLISFSNKDFEIKIYINMLLTFALIIISSPLHHSIYGYEQWSSGVIDGIAIYNFFDESQTRSFLQLFLSVLPFSLTLMYSYQINKQVDN